MAGCVGHGLGSQDSDAGNLRSDDAAARSTSHPALDVQVRQILPTGKSFQKRPAPANLLPSEITILHIYGNVFYARADISQAEGRLLK